MSKGPDNASKPYVWLKIEAIGTFEDPETVKTLTPQIFQFLTEDLKLEKDWILINYYKLEATHIGKAGSTVAELRAAAKQ